MRCHSLWPSNLTELPGAVGRGAKPPTPQKIRNFEYAFWFLAMAGYLNEGLVGGHRTTCTITPAPVRDRLECHSRAFAVVNYEQAVEPFVRTDRLSDGERVMLMGGACARAYGWEPKKG
jgi:hypothetical protein